jgi:hypothetical protein
VLELNAASAAVQSPVTMARRCSELGMPEAQEEREREKMECRAALLMIINSVCWFLLGFYRCASSYFVLSRR